MGNYGTAAPQGAPRSAPPVINSGLPTGGPAGGTEVVFPGRASNVPSNKSNKVA